MNLLRGTILRFCTSFVLLAMPGQLPDFGLTTIETPEECVTSCDKPNMTSCAPGECGCADGFGDCDGFDWNGCEADFRTDPENCGVCGTVCATLPNTTTATCDGGKCKISQCKPGYGDCNQLSSDGCEVDLFVNTRECGACGQSCNPTPNTLTTVCTAPLGCTIGSCTPNMGNCDGLIFNGCEANLMNDAANCGQCGNACPGASVGQPGYPSATSSCVASVCVFSCENESYDVDGIISNGCESKESPGGNHHQNSATVLSYLPAANGDLAPHQIAGSILSDHRLHPGLSVSVNQTVPDWYAIIPPAQSGHKPVLELQLITVSSGIPSKDRCFRASVISNLSSFQVQTNGNGKAAIPSQANAWSGTDPIYVKVEKLTQPEACATPTDQKVDYFINYRL